MSATIVYAAAWGSGAGGNRRSKGPVGYIRHGGTHKGIPRKLKKPEVEVVIDIGIRNKLVATG